VYRTARARLVDELGVEPGSRLRELESQILRQDPRLVPPPAAPEGSNIGAGMAMTAGATTGTRPTGPGGEARPLDGALDATARSGRQARWLVAAVAAILVAVGGAAVVWATGTERANPARPKPGSVFNEFDLAVNPGIGYDLDIPPDKPADWHATNNPRSPDYGFLDFYRTSAGPSRPGQISGVDLNNTNNFNAIHLVGPNDPVQMCRQLPQHGGGNVKLAHLTVGAKVCLRTWENRWAMLTITRMPPTLTSGLMLHVAVIND
jgi:hypothetical protein